MTLSSGGRDTDGATNPAMAVVFDVCRRCHSIADCPGLSTGNMLGEGGNEDDGSDSPGLAVAMDGE